MAARARATPCVRLIATAMFCHSFTHRGAEEVVTRGPTRRGNAAANEWRSHFGKQTELRGRTDRLDFVLPGEIKSEVFDLFFANCGFLLFVLTHPRPSGHPQLSLSPSLLNLAFLTIKTDHSLFRVASERTSSAPLRSIRFQSYRRSHLLFSSSTSAAAAAASGLCGLSIYAAITLICG